MSKVLTLSLLLSMIVLSSCGGSAGGNISENAGKAMAETACLLFDEEVSLGDMQSLTEDIMAEYGFEDAEAIDTYLATVRGTEEINLVSEAARTHLETTCGDALEASGVSAADLAEAMVSES